jgi:hypothetical protein
MQHNLFSLGQLANQGCAIQRTVAGITVRERAGTWILQGTKEPSATLWPIQAAPPTKLTYPITAAPADSPGAEANLLAVRNAMDAEYVKCAHAVFCSPPV